MSSSLLQVNTAFFRGNASGAGTDADTNQRINVALICKTWTAKKQNKIGKDNVPLLDAGITGFNVRDKKRIGI
jgi:hypothetical protein